MITIIPTAARSKRGVAVKGEVLLISTWNGNVVAIMRRKSDGKVFCLTRRARDVDMVYETKGAQRMFAKIMGYPQQAYVDLCEKIGADAEANEHMERIEEARDLLEANGYTVKPGSLK